VTETPQEWKTQDGAADPCHLSAGRIRFPD
jgi:hypothetical protein